ncbi:hypothetical protein JMJ77_0011279, partial [Colletotrichum scovillei]
LLYLTSRPLFPLYALSHHCLRYPALTCVVGTLLEHLFRSGTLSSLLNSHRHDDLLTSHRLISELRIPCPAPPTIHPSIGT